MTTTWARKRAKPGQKRGGGGAAFVRRARIFLTCRPRSIVRCGPRLSQDENIPGIFLATRLYIRMYIRGGAAFVRRARIFLTRRPRLIVQCGPRLSQENKFREFSSLPDCMIKNSGNFPRPDCIYAYTQDLLLFPSRVASLIC